LEPFPKKGNLVLRMKGDGSRKPLLLLAHLDVVEALRNDWQTDPFVLQETNGFFTARGSIDDKAMAASFVSILSQLKREGFKAKRDIILALTADEERGDVPSNGVYWIVNNRRELLDAELGLNEGGRGDLRNGKPVLNQVQVAEKMYTTYQLLVRNPGGHSSLPDPENAIYTLAEALNRLAKHRFPPNVGEVTREYFAKSAGLSSDAGVQADMRAVGVGEATDAQIDRLSKNNFYNAQLRTTCVATRLMGGHADNALPQSASATVNCRILPNDDAAAIDRELRAVLGPKIEIKQTNPPLASPASPLRKDVMGAVEAVTQEMWPGIPVIPSMSTGATDSRFLRNLGMPIYGVSGMFIDGADYRAHGLDERITQKALYDGREFLYRLVKRLAG
ncbi:MAG: M20/M25/M40 family metallo-hydrolase, partial [Betaproteobacteria bacterium]|nr:M20/M25/M40 family metallo-hydrolase [Betaproteobacteria bacterium]